MLLAEPGATAPTHRKYCKYACTHPSSGMLAALSEPSNRERLGVWRSPCRAA